MNIWEFLEILLFLDQAGQVYMLCRSSILFPHQSLHHLSPYPARLLSKDHTYWNHHCICNWVTRHSISQWSIYEPPSKKCFLIWVFKKLDLFFKMPYIIHSFILLIYFCVWFLFGSDHRKLKLLVPQAQLGWLKATSMYCTILFPMLIFHLDFDFWVLNFYFYFSNIILCVLKSP